MTVTDPAATLVPGLVLPKDGDRFAAWLADINWAKPVSYTHLTLPTNREV